MTPHELLDKANGSTGHVLVTGAVMSAAVGLIFWVGTVSNRLDYLSNHALVMTGNEEISSQAALRLTVVESLQKSVLLRLHDIEDHQRDIDKEINEINVTISAMPRVPADRK